MTLLTIGSLTVYASWRAMNAYQSYLYHKGLNAINIFEILFSLLMCYWLSIPSILFLIAKVIDGLTALGIGIYLNMQAGPEKFLIKRDKIVNGFWSYAITDTAICIACFFVAIMGSING